MKRIVSVFLLFLFLFTLSIAEAYSVENQYTLERCKELTLKNSTDIQQALYYLDLADKTKRDADENYEKLKANYFSEKQESTVVAGREAYRTALNNYNDQKIQLANLKKQLEYNVEKLYFDILIMEKDLNDLKTDLQIRQELIEYERTKLNYGMTTELMVEQLIQSYLSLKDAYEFKKDLLETQYWLMNNFIGEVPENPLKLIEIKINVVDKANDLSSLYNKVSDIYLPLNQLDRTLQEKEKDKDWYGYNMSEKIEDLDLAIRSAELTKSNTEFNLKQNLKTIIEGLELSKDKLITSEKNYNLTKSNYDFDKKKYELGLIRNIDLKSSQKNYKTAYNSYVKAGYDYYLALRTLELAEEGILVN